MTFSWLKLLILEGQLKLGAFGKYNRYRCWCLERNANTVAEKLRIARDVLNRPGVSLAESQHNVDYIRQHSLPSGKTTSQLSKPASAVNPEPHGSQL